MARNNNYRHGRNRHGNNEHSNRSDRNERNERNEHRHFSERDRRPQINPQLQKEIAEQESAIREFKANAPVCEVCGEPILEISNAINHRTSGKPVHFDCVIKQLVESEKPGPNDRVTYIGQGKFAVLHFENPHDMKHFTILKTIEWESRESERGEWRDTMAGLYSQIK